MLADFFAILAAPLTRFTDPADQFSIYSLMGALVCVLLVYALKPKRRAFNRIRAFFRAAFPSRIVFHRSTMLDIRLFIVTSMIYALGFLGTLASSDWLKDHILSVLVLTFGAGSNAGAPGTIVTLGVTLGVVIVVEFNYWFAHWLMHRFEFLWEFHKLHHSAEVMTPLTEWRQHPVELVLFPAMHAIGLGTYFAIVAWFVGPEASMFTLYGTNIALLVLMMTVLHLRHTHLWIAARGWLGHIIHSPAHHQIHHSMKREHMGKNLGLCLSIWDWAFGTLHVPARYEKLEFGIDTPHEKESVIAAYIEPFANISRQYSQSGPAIPKVET